MAPSLEELLTKIMQILICVGDGLISVMTVTLGPLGSVSGKEHHKDSSEKIFA